MTHIKLTSFFQLMNKQTNILICSRADYTESGRHESQYEHMLAS